MPPWTGKARATLQGWQGGHLEGPWAPDLVGCSMYWPAYPDFYIKNKQASILCKSLLQFTFCLVAV